MNSEAIIQDTTAIERKLEELRSMLETAKCSQSAKSMTPIIEAAIEAHEDQLSSIRRVADLKRRLPKRIILRATGLDTWAKDRHCSGIYYPEDDHYVFELDQTKRWFSICKFPPRAGYLLIPEDTNSQFEITSVSFLDKRPKKTVFTAVPSKAA